jgi:hypothetical protein
MANQAIALQARAPQGNFLAPAIQQGAQMINMMRQQQALDRQTAAQEQSMRLQMAGEGRAAADAARAAELQPFKVDEARNKSISDAIKVGMEFNKYINMSAADANSPEDFRAFAADIAANPLFQSDVFKNGLSQVVASIPNDPARFAEWKRQTGLKTIEKDKLYKNELIKQETADGTRQIAVDPYGNRGASVVPGSEVSLGQEITYVRGDDNSVRALPKRMAPAGGGLVGGARGGGPLGAGIEQAAQQLSPGVVVSGRARTPARNAEVDGVPNSYHLSDNARDFQPAKGQTVAQLAARLQPLKAQGYDVLAEGDHVHVEPGPRMGRAAAPAGGGGVRFGQVVPGMEGGKIDPQKAIKATTAAEAASVRYDRTIDAAEKLLKSPALDSIVGNFQGNIPETVLGMSSQGAANALALLNTLIARGGFAELQAMRDASPTGGALGQVSDRENTMLQNAAATLIRSQDEASFRENLKAYIAELKNSKERVQSAWSQQFGQPFPGAKPAAPPAANTSAAPAAATPAGKTGARQTPVAKPPKGKVLRFNPAKGDFE